VKLRETVRSGRRIAGERGQTTAEYALIILGVAVVAGALAKWAAGGAIERLFDSVISQIT
jgi:Flp pilus assembly pilin Flp